MILGLPAWIKLAVAAIQQKGHRSADVMTL